MPLGQLTHLPDQVAANPFHPLVVKFSRYKTGSFEILFTLETHLLKYSWIGLLALCALVLPPLEEVDVVSTLVRVLTILYPCFFIWSLTRLAGVELLQLMIEGRWTGELLASPLTDRDLTVGLITPLWVIVRQYLLISIFSLALYGLETTAIVVDPQDGLLLDNLIRSTAFYYCLFFSSVTWTVFVYLGRLFAEVRLRNGLLKGLATLFLLCGGCLILAGYCLLFFRYPLHMTDTPVLMALTFLIMGLIAGAAWMHRKLARNFRRYLRGQLDLDVLIYDRADPHVTAWEPLGEPGKPRPA
jgi:hypothetical protein